MIEHFPKTLASEETATTSLQSQTNLSQSKCSSVDQPPSCGYQKGVNEAGDGNSRICSLPAASQGPLRTVRLWRTHNRISETDTVALL